MKYTTQHQSQLFLGMGLDRNTADLVYPSNPNNRHSPLYDAPSLRYGMPMDDDDLPCWSYEQLYNVLGMYEIHFCANVDNVHISNDDKTPVVRDLEVFKFNQDEDYIFYKHFNDIISAVEWCLQEGYMKDPINCETPAGVLKVIAHVRYWEDAEVNGVDENENDPHIPCRAATELWCPEIDVNTGRILNWEQGVTASVHYKVCDECEIEYYVGNTLICNNDGYWYCPDFLCPEDNGYGDYIIMDIDGDGYIQGWDVSLVDDWLEEQRNRDE